MRTALLAALAFVMVPGILMVPTRVHTTRDLELGFFAVTGCFAGRAAGPLEG